MALEPTLLDRRHAAGRRQRPRLHIPTEHEVFAQRYRNRNAEQLSKRRRYAIRTESSDTPAVPERGRGAPKSRAGLRSLYEFFETGGKRADVARDGRMVIAGNDRNFEARKDSRPAEIRTIRR